MGYCERDLIKAAVANPKVLPQASVDKTMHKVWSGYTKLIRRSVCKGQSVICPQLGRLICAQTHMLHFFPNASLLSLGQFQYRGPASLLPEDHLSRSVPVQLSYGSIAAVCQLDRETVRLAIKEMLVQAVAATVQGNAVQLNLKVGQLKLSRGWVEFYVFNQALPHASNPNPRVQGKVANVSDSYKAQGAVQRVGTRVLHDLPLSKTELSQCQQQQIQTRSVQRTLDFKAQQKEDKEFLQELTRSNIDHALKEAHRKRHAKLEFVNSNKAIAEEKQRRFMQEKQTKLAENNTFFPFTYGDQVEARTKALLMQRRDDERRFLFTQKQAAPAFDWEKYDLPKFMVPDARQARSRSNQQVMKDAYDRHYKSLEARRVELRKLERERTERIRQDSFKEHQKEALLTKNLNDHGQFLKAQMQAKQGWQHKQQERFADPPGYYGPDSQDHIEATQEKLQKQELTRNALVLQMKDNDRRQQLNRSEALIRDLETNKVFWKAEQAQLRRETEQTKKTKATYKDALDKQVQLKALEQGVLRL